MSIKTVGVIPEDEIRKDLDEIAERLCFVGGCKGSAATCCSCASIYCELEDAERRGVDRAARFFLKAVTSIMHLDAALSLIDGSVEWLMRHRQS